MTDPSPAACSRCHNHTLTTGVSVGQNAESGWIGLKYKDGRLLLGTEAFLADVCNTCGHIERLYVQNTNHKWVIKKKKT